MALFLSWRRPSAQQQKACIDSSGGASNYDAAYRGATSGRRHGGPTADKSEAEAEAALSEAGFHVNRARILLGSGADTFRRAKAALRSWRHFRLGWAFVEPGTPVEKGTKFCVCVREFLPWIAMPLQIAYVTDTPAGGEPCGGDDGPGAFPSSTGGVKACFGFGSGTLRGHLLSSLYLQTGRIKRSLPTRPPCLSTIPRDDYYVLACGFIAFNTTTSLSF